MSRTIALLAALASAPTSSSAFVVAPRKTAAFVLTMPSHLQAATLAESLGDEKLSKIRSKVISKHSDDIGSFVDTADTKLGESVLRALFQAADRNGNGIIEQDELAVALRTLGFDWLKKEQFEGIFARTDSDGNGAVDLNEWMEEAPKTLSVFAPAMPSHLQATYAESLSKNWSEGETAVLDKPVPPKGPVPTPQQKSANKKKSSKSHQEGIFSSVVLVAKDVLGDETLNKIRAKVISKHSDVIGSFVDTADTKLGKAVLQALFEAADKNGNGFIEQDELAAALGSLGFDWLKEKQLQGIFARSDADSNGSIDLNEWMKEAPKTLRTNLIKLAKKNGGELGFLS
jgi:Ca2+-binding EF-hand superfamily protein